MSFSPPKHIGYELCLAVGLFIDMEMIVSFPRSGFTGFNFPARKRGPSGHETHRLSIVSLG